MGVDLGESDENVAVPYSGDRSADAEAVGVVDRGCSVSRYDVVDIVKYVQFVLLGVFLVVDAICYP